VGVGTNALTIDVEDWAQTLHWRMTGEVIPPGPDVVAETETVVSWLGDLGVRATFFVVADVAVVHPRLVKEIDACGHEVACHGLHHRAPAPGPHAFRTQVRLAKRIVESTLGKPIAGYRAANFAITSQSLWMLEVLAEEGFLYDSSVSATSPPEPRLGADGAPRILSLGSRSTLVEFPVTAVTWARRRWPAGGTYLHHVPYGRVRDCLLSQNARGLPALLYYHPYQLPKSPLRVRVVNPSLRALFIFLYYRSLHGVRRERANRTLSKVLGNFAFFPLREHLGEVLRTPERYETWTPAQFA
jgi:polysaccharide deacetylase family protein (PEP-CTERM system associated)